MNGKGLLLLVSVAVAGLVGCGGGGDQGRFAFGLEVEGLPVLRGNLYRGWAVVNGIAIGTGRFRIDDSTVPPTITDGSRLRIYGTTLGASFGPSNTLLGQAFPFMTDATGFFVTIENESRLDLIPTGNKILEGVFVGDVAELRATGFTNGDLSTATGSAVIATFTGAGAPQANGVWFVNPGPVPTPSLNLPDLLGSWTYEGFVSDGTNTWSLGKFTATDRPDDDASTVLTRGLSGIGPAAPGQDFLTLASDVGRSEILDLVDGDWRVEITAEPDPDNSTLPFPLLVLEGPIPPDLVELGNAILNADLFPRFDELPEYLVDVQSGELRFTSDIDRSLGSLGPLTAGYYQVWADVAGTPQSCGTFRVDAASGLVESIDGGISAIYGLPSQFMLSASNTGLGLAFPDVQAATRFFVTVEPQGDPLPEPSQQVVIAGPSDGTTGILTVEGEAAVGGPGLVGFGFVSGRFSAQTPSDNFEGSLANDQSGVWFTFVESVVAPSLFLPILPPGWKYEGWVVNDVTGARWSTGRFKSSIDPDDDALIWPGAGDGFGLTTPGQDFVEANPGTSIPPMAIPAGWEVFVTIEPFPDGSLDPTPLRVLEGVTNGTPGVPFTLTPAQTMPFPSIPNGRVQRN